MPLPTYENAIVWQSLASFENLHFYILDMDTERQIIDVIFKFAAGKQIVLHRHKVLNKTWVLQGEHRLYTANGMLKESRAVGSFTTSPASDEPHREGGGESDVIILFSIRGSNDVLYEILDDQQQVIAELAWQDFERLYAAQHLQAKG